MLNQDPNLSDYCEDEELDDLIEYGEELIYQVESGEIAEGLKDLHLARLIRLCREGW